MFFRKFEYGKTALCFAQASSEKRTKKSAVGLRVLQQGASYEPKGSDAPLFYAETSLGTAVPVKVLRQVEFLSGSLNSYLADETGAEYVHKLVYDRPSGVFTASIRFENKTKEEMGLKSLTAFCLGFDQMRGTRVYRMGSAFSYAYAMRSDSLEDLGLGFENSPPFSFGRDGRFLPFVAISQGENGVLAIRTDTSNPFEICLRRVGERTELYGVERNISKTLPAGGYFETCKVHFTLQPTLEDALRALNRRMANKITSDEDGPAICSAENIPLGNLKKFSAILRELKIPAAILEDGKRQRSEEEFQAAAEKLAIEGIRAERNAFNCFSLPQLGGATAIAAANITRILPARKILSEFEVKNFKSDEETIFDFCSAVMTRIKLKGELLKSGEERMALLQKLFAFSERIWEIVAKGEVFLCDFQGTVCAEPIGRQIYGKQFANARLIVVHFFGEDGVLKIPLDGYELKEQLSSVAYAVRSEQLRISGKANTAGAFLLEKR